MDTEKAVAIFFKTSLATARPSSEHATANESLLLAQGLFLSNENTATQVPTRLWSAKILLLWLESCIVLRDLAEKASTAEGLLHHEGKVELAQDRR